jgi:hypothetical protein
MSFTALSLNWQMTALFFLALLPLCFIMKLVAFWGAPESRDLAAILSPFLTPALVRQALPLSVWPRLVWRFLVALGVCVCAYWLYWQLSRNFRLPTILICYIGAIMLWLVSEALGSLAPFLALPSARLLPLPHGPAPPLAKKSFGVLGPALERVDKRMVSPNHFSPAANPSRARTVFGFSGLGHSSRMGDQRPALHRHGQKMFWVNDPIFSVAGAWHFD